jgi:hypothetical protein
MTVSNEYDKETFVPLSASLYYACSPCGQQNNFMSMSFPVFTGSWFVDYP